MLDEKLKRALITGIALFLLSLLGAAVSVALIKYFKFYELGLIYPTIGVLCMLYGGRILRTMEEKQGQNSGGAFSDFIRSGVAAFIVFLIPSICWRAVLSVSDIIIWGLQANSLPQFVYGI